MIRRSLLLALLVLCSAPAGAQAATVTVREAPGDGRSPGSAELTFAAAAGERNVVALARSGGAYLVRDTGAPLTPGAGCSSLDANTARCSSTVAITTEEIDAGDLDDVVRVPDDRSGAFARRVLGGDGHDVLSGDGSLYGGPGPDVLAGGPGENLLFGGGDGDLLLGGDGADKLDGDGDATGEAAPANDQLDGGPGMDVASYAGRTAGVRVELGDRVPDGGPADRDVLLAIEGAEGGSSADVLLGDGGPNVLNGNAGDDLLLGRDGADKLDDGPGADALYGGGGPDNLTAADPSDRAFGEQGDDDLSGLGGILDGGPGDDDFGLALAAGGPLPTTICGDGRDRLIGAPLREERIGRDCEELLFQPFNFFSVGIVPAKRRGNVLSVPATCAATITNLRRCDGLLTLRLRRPGRAPLLLGRRRLAIAPGRTDFVRVTVRRSARRALAAASRPLLDVQLAGHAVQRPKYHAPGGVDTTVRFAGRWRVRT
jgi:hypothetical protein